MFDDRRDAGLRLGEKLQSYRESSPIVLAIPRGGVEISDEVSRALDAELSLIISRKLPMPGNPETGFGAIAEDGSRYIVPDAGMLISQGVIQQTVKEQKAVIEKRKRVLRGGRPLPDLDERTAILVDDGIAMGSTMRAAVCCCRNRKAARVVVAAPVTGAAVRDEMRKIADDVVILETPPNFRAVAQVYRNWSDVSDEEVLEILERRKPG
ncbi:MAG: phosphoribosyltransferase [Candidatus Eisenbacteria bacterium]|nr:phosphoribosyltransferase [Candidatus Eisenbacteria bacterium]